MRARAGHGRRPRRVERGVTLIELMVVVAILAILAALGVSYWHNPGAGRISRTAQAMATGARRDAISLGVLQFTSGRTVPEPRVPCMPDAQLIVAPDQIVQWNCQLVDSAPPQPNDPGCPSPVTDDCAWDSIKANQLYLPTDMEVAFVSLEGGSRVAPTSGDPGRFYWRPNGSVDVHVTGGAGNIGGANETGRVWIRPKGVTDAECHNVPGRCYQILVRGLMGAAEVLDNWP
jgi:prepilin-type N-terminal cleavage/methylation domain-containing protein